MHQKIEKESIFIDKEEGSRSIIHAIHQKLIYRYYKIWMVYKVSSKYKFKALFENTLVKMQ